MSLVYDITFPSLPLSSIETSFYDWKKRKKARRVVEVVLVCVCLKEGTENKQSGLFLSPLLVPLFSALQCSVASITNLISHGHSYTQKFTIPHNICILYGDTYKDHDILIVMMIMIIYKITEIVRVI